jgi:hypothetical protein
MSKRKNNVDSLLAAIKRQAPKESTTASVERAKLSGAAKRPAKDDTKPEASPPAKGHETKRLIGQKVTIWMHDADRKLVRELAAWLAGQGLRPSDSMVIRAALRFVKTGGTFLETYQQASALDARFKRERTESPENL